MAAPFQVEGPDVTLTLDFSLLNAVTNGLTPAAVTGVDASDFTVSGALVKGAHYMLAVKAISPSDVVTSVSVELVAQGEWPDCTKAAQMLAVSFRSGGATPEVASASGVSASNIIYLNWAPGPDFIPACAPTAAPTMAPTAAPTPAPTLAPGATPAPTPAPLPSAEINFNIAFPEADTDRLQNDAAYRAAFEESYIAGVKEALGEEAEVVVVEIREGNTVVTKVTFPPQEDVIAKATAAEKLLVETANAEPNAAGNGLSLLGSRMDEGGFGGINLDVGSIATVLLAPPPMPPGAPPPPPTPVEVTIVRDPPPPPASPPTPAQDTTPTVRFGLAFDNLDISQFDDTAFDTAFRTSYIAELRAYLACPTCGVTIDSITAGSVVVATTVVYPEAGVPAGAVTPSALSTAMSTSPETVFRAPFQALYGSPVLSGTVSVVEPPAPAPAEGPMGRTTIIIVAAVAAGVVALVVLAAVFMLYRRRQQQVTVANRPSSADAAARAAQESLLTTES